MQRPLLLNGFMAVGKSTVGTRLAAASARPFVDLDSSIERRAGLSVSEIFRQKGEAFFRALERELLLEILSNSAEAPVVALGGGALLDRATRLHALETSVVVTLEASPAQILERAKPLESRPLLFGWNAAERVRELLALRGSTYAEAHARISTDGVSPETVAERVRAVWQRDPIAVAAGERSYAVDVGRGLIASRLPELLGNASLSLLISDANVERLHAPQVEAALSRGKLVRLVLEPGEPHKVHQSVERIWRAALDGGADRRSVFVALGGGVVTDLAGFAAACYMRGVSWVAIPSTLLAMVDASVGGKTGFDLGAAKNAIGAFWQPSGVICDVGLLDTEPERGFLSALAEVVKTALIGDAELFEILETGVARVRRRDPELVSELVRRSVRVKAHVVGIDERESGPRATLNLGHTLGHALEAHGGFTRLTHGEAVSLGLVAALRIGERLGLTPKELASRTVRLLAELGLPVELEQQPLREAAALISHDKKRAGDRLRFALARELGTVELVELGLEQIRQEIQALA